MRRFERSNQCLALAWHLFSLPTPLQSGIGDHHQEHVNSKDYLSRQRLEEGRGSNAVRVTDTGMGAAAGGVRRVPVPSTRMEGGSNSPCAERVFIENIRTLL